MVLPHALGLPWWLRDKESAYNARDAGLIPCVAKIPWRRKWQPAPVFLPRKAQGQRSLAGHSPRGHKSWTQLSNEASAPPHTPYHNLKDKYDCVHENAW